MSRCDLEVVSLNDHLLEWSNIYDGLVAKKGIRGPALFPGGYFEALSQLPGLTTFAAFHADVLVAAALWVRADDLAYYHLGASRPEGYRSQAMYGLVATAVDYFQDCGILDLGGVPGMAIPVPTVWLSSNEVSPTTFVSRDCAARFFNKERYAELMKSALNVSFFPTYRASSDRSPCDDN